MSKGSVGRDTCFLSVMQLLLQALGLMLNVFLTRRIGPSQVGVVTLISTFFGLCAVLASGNGFVSTSRFVSEEIGRSSGNPERVLRYAGICSLLLSLLVGGSVFVLAPWLAERFLKSAALASGVRLLAVTLPFASICACLKGYFHARRRVTIPAAADAVEFLMHGAALAFGVIFLLPGGHCSLFMLIVVSMLLGQLAAFCYLGVLYQRSRRACSNACTMCLRGFAWAALPLLLNSYLTSLLSTANDALIPFTLRQFGHSTEEAFAQFGVFEALLLPALFFPAVVLGCLSSILVPELSRNRGAGSGENAQALIGSVLRRTLRFAGFVMLLFLLYGSQIGTLIGGDAFAGRMLRILAPVIPFIYLEIVLEGILRGMGKQNFSSVNYLAEYMIRISVLLICVPIFGFYGILASYYASNVIGNLVRLWMVRRLAGGIPWGSLLLRPGIALFAAWQCGMLLCGLLRLFALPLWTEPAVFLVLGGGVYLFALRVLDSMEQQKKTRNASLHSVSGSFTVQTPPSALPRDIPARY